MIYLVLVLMCILFIEIVYGLGMMGHLQNIISHAKEAMDCLLSKQKSDLEKEKAARDNSLAIFKDTLFFVMKFGLAVGIVLLPYMVILYLTEMDSESFANIFVNWSLVIALSLFSIIYIKIRYGHFH